MTAARAALLLVGASACWSSRPAEPVQPVKIVTTPSNTTCVRDAIVETICGAVGGSPCKSRADALRSIDTARLFVTKPVAPMGSSFEAEDRAKFRDFELDHDDTQRYRNELAVENELSQKQIDGHCCYSRCTPLVVGRPTATNPPIGLPTPEVCIPRPPGGTSVGAPGDARCPHGVTLDGVLRSYVKTTDDQCCYDMR